MSDLLILAAEAGAATADQQADLLNAAWDALGPHVNWSADQARRFGMMMDAEAFESAAIMLAPSRFWAIIPRDDGLVASVWTGVEQANPEMGSTPALALIAACLKGHAALIEARA